MGPGLQEECASTYLTHKVGHPPKVVHTSGMHYRATVIQRQLKYQLERLRSNFGFPKHPNFCCATVPLLHHAMPLAKEEVSVWIVPVMQ